NAGTEWCRPNDFSGREGWAWPRAASTNVPIAADDIPALVAFAGERQVDLTVVGPEAPLAAGIADALQSAGLRVFGPSREAARLESSKAFAKAFMGKHAIPTAAYATFDDYAAARRFLIELARRSVSSGVVVKADGLAAGKGVVICADVDEAQAALQRMMLGREFGTAGDTVVIEERLSGPEVSVLAFTDGHTVVPMPPARDHKRVYDGDRGPNTGGMGAYAPVPDVSAVLADEICRTILQPTVDGLAAHGTPYVGVLYAGLMLTPAGPTVLEFNCRFGDPETQAILPLLETDLVDVLLACVEGRLNQVEVRWRPAACATVVLASPGYPGSYPKGLPVCGLDGVASRERIAVFHAGTAWQDGCVVTAGGRVLAVSGLGVDLPAALRRAYAGVECIHFEGSHYRRDIGLSIRDGSLEDPVVNLESPIAGVHA
ncbi:MAG TPA: phosphoribosylamine--glycine ligase, partial [Chloroflexi bacterium]|nr:phosphoribosylamine--glycine ligase [Chloroflexota bacterium]